MRKLLLTINSNEYKIIFNKRKCVKKEGDKMIYTNLKAEMARYGVTIESIAKTLGIHRNSVANKIKGKSSFSIDEASTIQKEFFPKEKLQFLFEREQMF